MKKKTRVENWNGDLVVVTGKESVFVRLVKELASVPRHVRTKNQQAALNDALEIIAKEGAI